MKKVLFVSTMLFALVFSNGVLAQDFPGLDKSPMDMASFPSSYKIQDKAIRVIYSRPQLKGRSLEQLAPQGQVWRTGANEATEITFFQDATFGGKKVKAGTYALFTIPGENEWKVILNSQLNQWGAYTYDAGANLVEVTGEVSNGKPQEEFSIAFKDDGTMVMAWGTVRVSVPIVFQM